MPPDPEEEHLLKNSRTKKLKTQWENSITQGKNSRFGQNLWFFTIKYVCFSSMPPLLLFKPIKCQKWYTVWGTLWKRADISMNFAKYSQFLEEKLKTQAKNSGFRQIQKPGLPKGGRKNKPDLSTCLWVSVRSNKKFWNESAIVSIPAVPLYWRSKCPSKLKAESWIQKLTIQGWLWVHAQFGQGWRHPGLWRNSDGSEWHLQGCWPDAEPPDRRNIWFVLRNG